MELIGAILGATFVAFILGALLTSSFGRPSELRVAGLIVAFAIPIVLAIWDPDGSCDDCFLNFSPGEWFFLGGIAAVFLYLGWAMGVWAGDSSRIDLDGRAEQGRFRLHGSGEEGRRPHRGSDGDASGHGRKSD